MSLPWFAVFAGAGSMLFDTDVLIWVLRGNAKAAKAVDGCDARGISVVTTMELLQGARNKAEARVISSFLAAMHFATLPLTENIGHRGLIYMEEYGLSGGMSMADALIAATAIEANEHLITGSDKHYKAVKELDLCRFRP
jgi:predicted nucleic acid-binding protein